MVASDPIGTNYPNSSYRSFIIVGRDRIGGKTTMKPNNIVALALLVVGVVFLVIGVTATASCTPFMQVIQNWINTTWIWPFAFLFTVSTILAFLNAFSYLLLR